MLVTVQNSPKNHAFVLSLLISALVIAFFTVLAPVRFETNDDVVMLLIASGVYTGTPDQHLVFIHVVIGFLLKFLYQNFDGIEFYTFLQIAAHVYASAVILTFLKRLELGKTIFALLILLLLVFEFASLIRLQFTITSGILATAAVIQLLPQSRWSTWGGIISFLMAVLLRFEAAMLVLIIATPLLLSQNKLSQGIKLLILLVCAATMAKAMDKFYYSMDAQWRNYKIYDSHRGKINDNPNEKTFKSASEAEQNDYLLLLRFLPNPSAFSAERLQEIAAMLKDIPLIDKIKNVQNIWQLLGVPMLLLLLIFAILLINLHKHDRWMLASAIVVYLMIFTYINLNGTFKPRVFSISIAPLLFSYLPYLLKKTDRIYLSKTLYISMLTFAIGLAYASKKELASHPQRAKMASEQMDLINKYHETHKKAIFTVTLKSEYLNPFKISHNMRDKQVIYGGWLTKAPFPNQLQSFEDLFSKSMLVSKAELLNIVPMTISSIKNNHGTDATFKVMAASDRFVIIEFQKN